METATDESLDLSTRAGIIQDIQQNLETLNPRQVSNYSVHLSVLLAGIGEELAHSEIAYHKKWVEIRDNTETDGAAEKRSKASEEYYRRRLLETQFKSTKEIINSLKKRLDVLRDESHANF